MRSNLAEGGGSGSWFDLDCLNAKPPRIAKTQRGNEEEASLCPLCASAILRAFALKGRSALPPPRPVYKGQALGSIQQLKRLALLELVLRRFRFHDGGAQGRGFLDQQVP